MSKGILTLFAIILMGSIQPYEKGRVFIDSPFRPDRAAKINKVLINFNDSIPDDTLTIYFSATSIPEAFSRNIYTAVCIDSLCRPVDITLYWEMTGKCIGYSLPPGEELTKREHVSFLEGDYKRLSEILSDSTSQLGFYSPEEIHPAKQAVKKSDGITGATLPDLSPWIVPEAAYTSYTIWHLTYGATRDSLMNYTKKYLLSNQLLTNILQKKDPYNQIMALRWISESDLNSNQFIEPALAVLGNGNYQSSRQALKFLKLSGIDKERLQMESIKLLESEEFRIKNLAIEYIRESKKLTGLVAQELMNHINTDNYYLVNVILSLLEKRTNPDYADQLSLQLFGDKALDRNHGNIIKFEL